MAIPAPKGLKTAGRKLWKATVESFELRQDEQEVLRAVCAEADLIARMEEELAGAPLTVKGSMGQLVPHPLVTELRQHRATMATLLRGMKLPDEAGDGASNQQREAAQSRWAAAHGSAA